MSNNGDDLLNKIINLKSEVRDLFFQHWLSFEVFKWVWWLEVVFNLVVFFVWLKLVDKRRIFQIVIFGFLINIAATFLDVAGSQYVLWEYKIRIIPQLPLLYPVDFVILPVIDMLIYQYFTTWKRFILVNTIMAAILAFVLEPLSGYINQYQLLSWKYIYSFPIYILIAIYAKLVTGWIAKAKKDS